MLTLTEKHHDHDDHGLLSLFPYPLFLKRFFKFAQNDYTTGMRVTPTTMEGSIKAVVHW